MRRIPRLSQNLLKNNLIIGTASGGPFFVSLTLLRIPTLLSPVSVASNALSWEKQYINIYFIIKNKISQ